MTYVELQVTSDYSFHRGASSPLELFEQAKALGMEALALCDRNTLISAVRGYMAEKETGIRHIVGCRLDLVCGSSILVYPMDREGYGRLCRLLSLGKARAGKGRCELHWEDLAPYSEGLLAILVPDLADDTNALDLARLKRIYGNRAYMALTLRRRPNDALRLFDLTNQAAGAGVLTVATNDVLFHAPERRLLQDVVTAIRHHCTVDELGERIEPFADRYLKPEAEMLRLFRRYKEAVGRSADIAARCTFSMGDLKYQYPKEQLRPDVPPQEALRLHTWDGVKRRYPDGCPEEVIYQIKRELRIIEELQLAPYFLTVHSIVNFARDRGILCQGRGSAANSCVCFCLGITNVDPALNQLLFDRFISADRGEPPDIDVDFEHSRREEVIQWLYDSYGRDRAALTSVITRYRPRSAIVDVGKALGLPEDLLRTMSRNLRGWGRGDLSVEQFNEIKLNFNDKRLSLTLELAEELLDRPRHLSQHPGGFVLTENRLDEVVPIEPASMEKRQVIEWDKHDLDDIQIMKVDVLALGALTMTSKALELILQHKGQNFEVATIPPACPQTYKMIREADTVGVFQVESRAQMSFSPKIAARSFYDLVIQLALVRPGPIQGMMIHPYLRRRRGDEPVTYPHPALEDILSRTLGIPLFQEQAMALSTQLAGLTPGEADAMRRSFKHRGGIMKFRDKLLNGMAANGVPEEHALRIFQQLEGFGAYGFPESHSASFALITYATAWLKRWHPDAFVCALLNSQPMGFYAPAQVIQSFSRGGVTFRPVCVNASRWDCTLEPTSHEGKFAVRLGLRQIRGFSAIHAAQLVAARSERMFKSIDDVWQRSGLPPGALTTLANADVFLPSLNVDRRQALWEIKAYSAPPLPLFAEAGRAAGDTVPEVQEAAFPLARMKDGDQVAHDYQATGFTLRDHPMKFLRYDMAKNGTMSTSDVHAARDKAHVFVAGLVTARQRPGSAKGVVFLTIEDEGPRPLSAIIPAEVYERQRAVVNGSSLILVSGRLQVEGEVRHVIARHVTNLNDQLTSIPYRDAESRDAPAPPDYSQAKALHLKSRNYH